jgi:hypothetical protein
LLYLRDYCIPFFQQYSVKECLELINNPGRIDETLVAHTDWLAQRLSGIEVPFPGTEGDDASSAEELVKLVHSKLPHNKPLVKEYVISKMKEIPGASSSTKGKATKIQTFTDAVEKSSLVLFRPADGNAWQRLNVDYAKLVEVMNSLGGVATFGGPAQWGDVFAHRDEQLTYTDKPPIVEWTELVEQLKRGEFDPSVAFGAVQCECLEYVNVTNLALHHASGTDRRPAQLQAYLSRVNADGIPDGPSHRVLNMSYSTKPGYGRKMARGASGQKLTREARAAAFGDTALEIDMPCSHPRLLLAKLKVLGLFKPAEYPMLVAFCEHFAAWRDAVKEMKQITEQQAKMAVLMIFYGGRDFEDIPFLRKLTAEVQVASRVIMAHSSLQAFTHLYSDRRRPDISRLCAVLSFEEDKVISEVFTSLDKHGVFSRVLLFDGAYIRCKTFADEVLIKDVLHDLKERSGAEVIVKSWPTAISVMSVSRKLLHSGKLSLRQRALGLPGQDMLWSTVRYLLDSDWCGTNADGTDFARLVSDFNAEALHSSQRDLSHMPTARLADVSTPSEIAKKVVAAVCCYTVPGEGLSFVGVEFLTAERAFLYDVAADQYLLLTTVSDLANALESFADVAWLEIWPENAAYDEDLAGGAPRAKAARFTCAANAACTNPSHGICFKCQKHACANHSYRGDSDVVLACKDCGGEAGGLWCALEAEWSCASETAQLESSAGNLNNAFDHGFHYVCLIDSLRALGFHVPYSRSGPFMALQDGNEFLKPFNRQLVRLSSHADPGHGAFVVWQAGHFFAAKSTPTDTVLLGEVPSPGMTFSEMSVHAGVVLFKVAPMDMANVLAGVDADVSGGALKRPASAMMPDTDVSDLPIFVNASTLCKVCGERLHEKQDVEAVLYEFAGQTSIVHRQKQCLNRHCRRNYGYHYYWQGGERIHCGNVGDLRAIFATSKTAFSIEFLKYHAALQFRGCLSSRAIDWCGRHTLWRDESGTRFHKMYDDARFLLNVVTELEDMASSTRSAAHRKLCDHIVIGNELTETAVQAYDRWLHDRVLAPSRRRDVTAVAIDGHEKVMSRICGDAQPMRRAGRPRDDGHVKKSTNGWFMMVDPSSGRILSVNPMTEPENNDIAFGTVEKVIGQYPAARVLIYDRACKLKPSGSSRPLMRQFKVWAVDKWHGYRHTEECACSPWNHDRIWNALEDYNTSIAEQTFSWFRGYASTFNSMRPLRHRLSSGKR